LVILIFPIQVDGASSDSGYGNLTLQNDRIAVFGSSWSAGYYGSCLGDIVGREVVSFILPDTGLVGAMDDCATFNNTKFGIIITPFGANDYWPQGRPWEEVEKDLRQLLRLLKSTGAVVVYNQLIPESLGYLTGQVCQQEGVILVPKIAEGIGLPMNLSPWFFEGDPIHPSGEGYCVMAERTARVLLDSGLVESAQTCEDLSPHISTVFSQAQGIIDAAEAIGAYTQPFRDGYDLAEYIRDMDFCYTANWSLNRRVIDPLESFMTVWGGVGNLEEYFSEMFETVNASIQDVYEMGLDREAMLMGVDYSRAEKAWNENDYDTAKFYLDKVQSRFEEIPETFSPTILLLILLPAFLKQWRETISHH
jgi:hypothetical protein